jgi:peroxiredoxin
MKTKILSAILLSPLALLAQSNFTIKGSAKAIPNGNKIYLTYMEKGKMLTDSAVVSNGAFEFKGTIDAPSNANLFNNINPYKKGANTRNLDYTSIYVEPGNIIVTSADSIKSVVASGTSSNDDNQKLKAMLKPITEREQALSKEYASYTKEQKEDKALMEALGAKFEEVGNQKTPIIVEFIKKNPNSYISLAQLKNLVEDEPIDKVEGLYAGLSSELKSSDLGTKLLTAIDAAKKTSVGAMAMDFTQNDPDGKPVKLSDFRGKYVLVDFWASWCGPCRAENPHVVEAYQKFKDKNFTVLGVSLDGGNTRTTKEAWLKAVEKDQLTWTHVSDLKGWENEAARAWGIRGIPANFLIDPDGKIVAKNLRGQALQDKLAEILGKTK